MSSVWMRIAVLGIAGVLGSHVALADDTTSDDKKFLEDSAQGSLFEIEAAKLALSKSGDPNVKMFATKMVKDHTMLINSMKPIASSLGVKPPTGPTLLQKAKLEELKLKSGISFDRAYVETMVKDHHDDLKDFTDEEQKTANPKLKAAVEKGAEVIKGHTQMIDGIADKGGIEHPATPGV